MNASSAQLYLDDFSTGQTFVGSLRTISDSDVRGFASLTGDNHPIHYDAEYAKNTRFGRPIVHGLHLMGLTAVGATPLSPRLKESMIAFLEQGANFLKPVFVGDSVRSAFEVKEVAPAAGGEWGRLKLRATLTNQRGETVLEAFHVYRIRCRTARNEVDGDA